MSTDLAFRELTERLLEPALADPPAGPPEQTMRTEHAVAAVVGLGQSGLSTAIALGAAGAKIVGIESSPRRLHEIRFGGGELSVSEKEALRQQLDSGRFVLTDRLEALEAADLVLLCLPTATDGRRRPDRRVLASACSSVVSRARAGQTIVLMATAAVGTTRELLARPLEARGLQLGRDVFVAYSPEIPGEGARARAPRIVGAVTESCFARTEAVLRHIYHSIRRVSSPDVAEMIRLYEGTFHAVGVALSFEMADACRAHGLDAAEVADGAASRAADGGRYPALSSGGPADGVDAHHLTDGLRELGHGSPLAELALERLSARPRHIFERAREQLAGRGDDVQGARVLVVGVARTPGSSDCRMAPGPEVIEMLRGAGAQVEYHDPCVPEIRLDEATVMSGIDPDPRRDGSGFGPEDYDLAIVLTVQPGLDYGWLQRCPSVLDCTYRTSGGRERRVP